MLGISFPGCPETYEEPQGQTQQHQDRHQKVRYLKQGDIVAIPTMPYWTYNYGNTPLVLITLHKEHHKSKSGKQEEEGNNVFSGFELQFLAEALNVNGELAKEASMSR